MRVTIAHEKGQQEARRIVDRSADELIHSVAAGPVKILDPVKSWEGNTMTFSFRGKMGLFGASVHGTILVNEKDIVIDVELPGMVKQFVSEDKVRAALENKGKLLLA
ncbi:MAG: polyhydroxyalkanoic acid system family protein [Bryobacteraceae bacterium]